MRMWWWFHRKQKRKWKNASEQSEPTEDLKSADKANFEFAHYGLGHKGNETEISSSYSKLSSRVRKFECDVGRLASSKGFLGVKTVEFMTSRRDLRVSLKVATADLINIHALETLRVTSHCSLPFCLQNYSQKFSTLRKVLRRSERLFGRLFAR